MSASAAIRRITVPQLRARKGQEPIVALTAYTTPMARLLDPHADFLLVGDSVGMVVHGLESTVGVTVEMMALHTAAVRRGSGRAAIVADVHTGGDSNYDTHILYEGTGVPNVNNGLYQSGVAAPGTYEAGTEDYDVIKNRAA